jgi:hypothetical protein
MSTTNPGTRRFEGKAAQAPGVHGKRAYQKPAFRHERVFETMALACGKINATQGQCRSNRKNS